VQVGWPKRKQIAISGAATARTVADAIAQSVNGRQPGELESVEEALSRFTAAQYGRSDNGAKDSALDASALDESLRAGQQVLRRLKFEQSWLMKRLWRHRRTVIVERRVWSH
jgi:hypothetical protein